jgi:hypothetical protein
MWNLQTEPTNNLNSGSMNQTKSSKCSVTIEELELNEKEVENSEHFISGTQGSMILNVSQEEGDDFLSQRKRADDIMNHEVRQKSMPSPIPVRRVSERLKKIWASELKRRTEEWL